MSIALQLWLVFVPPQSIVSIEPPLSQVPTQPVRLDVPSWIAAPEKDPSAPIGVVPLSSFAPVPLVASVIAQLVCVTQIAALEEMVPHPCPLNVTE